MPYLREFCAENMELVPAAVAAGAERIELCDNLAVGGTTPSYGVIRAAVAYARPRGVAVMTMVRPRGGNFAYTDAELDIMCDDLAVACELDSSGVVFGCVRDGKLDCAATARLLDAAHAAGERRGERVRVTFHMAFDEIEPGLQGEAIAWLAEHGVDRVLTHGGLPGTGIEGNLAHLRTLVEEACGRLTILPGGGITWRNGERIAAELGVRELHGTRIVRLGA